MKKIIFILVFLSGFAFGQQEFHECTYQAFFDIYGPRVRLPNGDGHDVLCIDRLGQNLQQVGSFPSGRTIFKIANINPSGLGSKGICYKYSALYGALTTDNHVMCSDVTKTGFEDWEFANGQQTSDYIYQCNGGLPASCPAATFGSGFGGSGGVMGFSSGAGAGATPAKDHPTLLLINSHIGHEAAGANLDNWNVVSCSAGSVVVTFANSFISTPVIIVSDETTAGGARVSAKSNTAFTITCSGATDVVDYLALGHPY